MPTWPRAILPATISPLQAGGALLAWSDTGKAQARATGQIGWSWTETYPPFRMADADGAALLAFIMNVWRNGLSFTVDYRPRLIPLGSGTGSPLVAGASQTGSSLDTDTWTGSDPVLKAGDLISIAGVSGVRMLTANAPNLSAGAATLSITPPIFSGAEPADNAGITYSGVTFTARIAGEPALPQAGVDGYLAGLTIAFRESP